MSSEEYLFRSLPLAKPVFTVAFVSNRLIGADVSTIRSGSLLMSRYFSHELSDVINTVDMNNIFFIFFS